jgi:hypothetical protein
MGAEMCILIGLNEHFEGLKFLDLTCHIGSLV